MLQVITDYKTEGINFPMLLKTEEEYSIVVLALRMVEDHEGDTEAEFFGIVLQSQGGEFKVGYELIDYIQNYSPYNEHVILKNK